MLKFRYSLCFMCLVFMQLFSILSCSSLQHTSVHLLNDTRRKASLVLYVLLILIFFVFFMREMHNYFGCVRHEFPEHCLCLIIATLKLAFNYIVRCVNHQPFNAFKYVKYTFDFD